MPKKFAIKAKCATTFGTDFKTFVYSKFMMNCIYEFLPHLSISVQYAFPFHNNKTVKTLMSARYYNESPHALEIGKGCFGVGKNWIYGQNIDQYICNSLVVFTLLPLFFGPF